MRLKLLLVLIITSVFTSSFQNKPKIMAFQTSDIDLGTVPLKGSKNAVFYYTNESKSPVIILEAKTSCGCTKVKYSRRPTVANARDSVVVTYEPNETGVFYKKIILKNSSGESNVLIVKGVVK